MENKSVLVIAMGGENREMNILFGDKIKIPDKGNAGDTVEVSLGGGMTLPVMLTMLLATFKTMKDRMMSNPNLKEEDHLPLEQEIYSMLNIAVGTYLDEGFPLVNRYACLTEEACVQYGLDPKTATPEELLEAENKFIDEFPDRARLTSDMQLEKPKPVENRETRRKAAKEKKPN